jgi:CheY-like chemotaxis protein
MDEKAIQEGIPKPSVTKNQVPVLEELISDLVHKLNNPLASIRGFSELILSKTEDPGIKKEVEMILREADRASHIVRNLVAFTKKRDYRKEPVDLNRLIEEVVREKAEELRAKNITLTKRLSASLPMTMADPQEMKQVFINLIENAEEAINQFHGFGEIQVTTHVIDSLVEVIFSDDGPGIKQEDILKVFNLFFTTKNKGVGLGLPTSLNIVLRHEGRLWAESEWGKGAKFYLRLPIVGRREKKGTAESERARQSLQGFKGLVIDDELPVLDFVSKYLIREGARIEAASDVESALRIIDSQDFDFIVCDIRMPGMDGEAFYRIIGQKKPFLQSHIIFSTGDVLSRKTKAFVNSIKNRCLEKPYDLQRLNEAILELLNTAACKKR